MFKRGLSIIVIIFLAAQFPLSVMAGDENSSLKSLQQYQKFFDGEKERLINELREGNKELPSQVFGLSSPEFDNIKGNIGYIQSNMTLDFKEVPYMNLPKLGKKAKLVFKEISVIGNQTVKLDSNLPVNNEGYEIVGYKLLTCFLDSSKEFYQLYYIVKYK